MVRKEAACIDADLNLRKNLKCSKKNKKNKNKNTNESHNVHSSTVGKLKIFYTNADTVTNKWEELMIVLNTENPDVIAITEVKPKYSRYDISDPEISIQGYCLYSKNIAGKTGRGVAVYIKENITSEEIATEIPFEEIVLTKLKINKKETVIFGCVYRSNSGTENNNNLLNDLIKQINTDFIENNII